MKTSSMNRWVLLRLCAIVGGVVLAATACDSVTPAVVVPVAPTQAAALSADSGTTVRLRWRASTSETSLTGYRVTATPSGGGQTVVASVAKKTSLGDSLYTVDISSLRLGTTYTFAIQARTSDTVSTALNITWAPASRLRRTGTLGPIRLYESASTFHSAIRFQGASIQETRLSDAAQATSAELAIATPTRTDSIYIGTPNSLYSGIANGRQTAIDITGIYQGVDSLNQIYEAAAAATNFRTGSYGLRATQPKGLLFYCRTADGNFAKVFVKPGTGGSIFQGTSPNRYIEVEISYQPTANVGYTFLAPKSSGSVQESGFTRIPGTTASRNFPLPTQQR